MDQRVPKPDWLAALEVHVPDLEERCARHFAEHHVSAMQHSQTRRLSLGAELGRKTRIYLDLKYWIFCRDAHLGTPAKPEHEAIWRALCALVDNGHAVCPVAYPVLVETLKQGDVQRRRATAAVIDRLGCRVAIQPFHELVRIEMYQLVLRSTKGREAVCPLEQLVWTYAGWIVGEMICQNAAFDQAANNAIQKCMFDVLSAAPFSSIIEAIKDREPPVREDTKEYYAKLNADAAQYQHEVTSFETVFLSEVAGTLDTLKPHIAEMLCHHHEKETGHVSPPPDSSETLEGVRQLSNLFYHAYRLKKWNVDFPFLHIKAGIHAALRHRRQPYRMGDHWDHLHAHPALAYCDAFLTEKSLGTLLCTPPLNYDIAYGCRVLWNEEDVLAFLRSVEQQRQTG